VKVIDKIESIESDYEDAIYDHQSKKLLIYKGKNLKQINLSFSEDEIQELLKNFPKEYLNLGYGSIDYNNYRITVVLSPITSSININIRKSKKLPFSPTEMIKQEFITIEALAYLWIFVDGLFAKPANILIVGQAGSGKTSFLNSLSIFIGERERIVSIEDVREINLLSKNWIPLISTGRSKEDLLSIVFRLRPDRFFYGEIRSKTDAMIFFEAINSGLYGCMSTYFALNSFEAINTLSYEPISIPLGLLKNLDIIVVLRRFGDRRFVSEISEIERIEYGKPVLNVLFSMENGKLKFNDVKVWFFEKLSKEYSISLNKIYEELENRKMILSEMLKRNIDTFLDARRFIFSL